MQRGLHGLEYSFLSVGMAQKSKIKFSRMIIYSAGCIFLLLLAVYLFGFQYMNPKDMMPSDVSALVVLFYFVEYFHYYIDSQFFKLSDGVTRKHIRPLLVAGI